MHKLLPPDDRAGYGGACRKHPSRSHLMLVCSFHSTHTVWGTASFCPASWMADITGILLPHGPGSVGPTPLPSFLHESALGRGHPYLSS